MSVWVRILEGLGERVNPVTLKELRQAVQGKFAIAVLMLLLLLQLVVIGWVLVAYDSEKTSMALGGGVFMALHNINLLVCLCLVPAYTGIRLSAERSGHDVDLIYITTISPGAIVRGKLWAALALTLLVFSSSAPFMALTYFLRGIDLTTILVMTVFAFLVVAMGILLAILVGCLNIGRVAKILVGLLLVILLFWNFVVLLFSSSQFLLTGGGGVFSTSNFWLAALLVVLTQLLVMAMLFVLSIAMITPRTANRALPVRLTFSAIWLVSGIAFSAWSYKTGTQDYLAVWCVLMTVTFCLALFVAVSEREKLGPRLRRAIPARRQARALAFFLYSGAGGGLCWAALMLALTSLWCYLLPRLLVLRGDAAATASAATLAAGLYCLAYALFGLQLRRRLLTRLDPKHSGTVGLGLAALGCLLPLLSGALLAFDSWQTMEGFRYWLAGNPFAVGTRSFQGYHLTIAAIMAAVAFVSSRSWISQRISDFQRLEIERPAGEPAMTGSFAPNRPAAEDAE